MFDSLEDGSPPHAVQDGWIPGLPRHCEEVLRRRSPLLSAFLRPSLRYSTPSPRNSTLSLPHLPLYSQSANRCPTTPWRNSQGVAKRMRKRRLPYRPARNRVVPVAQGVHQGFPQGQRRTKRNVLAIQLIHLQRNLGARAFPDCPYQEDTRNSIRCTTWWQGGRAASTIAAT